MAIRIHRHGGTEEMVWEPHALPELAAGEVRVRHTAIGINFSDINVRRGGFYWNHLPDFPLVLGNEAAGVVEAVAAGVTDFVPGDRVAYAGIFGQFYEDTGAYAERRNVPAARLAAVPDNVTDEQAAAILLKGSTASLIINRLYRPSVGDAILVNTAAAGVGSILCQWAKHLGATVVGTVGSRAKAELAQANGCDHVVLYRETDLVEAVRAVVPGGLAAIYDGVGKDTFLPSLELLGHFGHAVNYGNASGSVPPLDVQSLAIRSLSVSRAGVTGHIADTASLRAVAAELFQLVGEGVLRPTISERYALLNAAKAHGDVEAARFVGTALLIP